MVGPTTEGPTGSANEAAQAQGETLDLREAALDARELALNVRDAAHDDRLNRGKAVTEAADRRDVAADTRDAVANKRDMTHTRGFSAARGSALRVRRTRLRSG